MYDTDMRVQNSGFKAKILSWDTVSVDESPWKGQISTQLTLRSRFMKLRNWQGAQDPVIQSEWSESYIASRQHQIDPRFSSLFLAGYRARLRNIQDGRLLLNFNQAPVTSFQISPKNNLCLVQIARIENQGKYCSVMFCLLIEPHGEEGLYRRIGVVEVPIKKNLTTKGWKMRTVKII
jgi:hypothetical protein